MNESSTSIAGLALAAMLSLAACSSGDPAADDATADTTADAAAPVEDAADGGLTLSESPAASADTTNVAFVSGFLEKVTTDETFRDACSDDLDACLESAGMTRPLGLKMEYDFGDDKTHSVTYAGLAGGQVSVTVDAEGKFEVADAGGMASRGDSLAMQWFKYKCYVYTSFQPFMRSCRTGQTYCSCAENLDKYPCNSGLGNAVMQCENQ